MGYVPGKLIVDGNAAATANNVVASETLFRLGIAGNPIGQAGFIFVALALYELLKGVNQQLAALMVILIVVSIPISFLNEVNSIAALLLVRGGKFLAIVEKPQRDALAMLFLNLHNRGFTVAETFWGLRLFPLGLLVYRSRFPPRFLGVWLIIAGSKDVLTRPWKGRSSTLTLNTFELGEYKSKSPPSFANTAKEGWGTLVSGSFDGFCEAASSPRSTTCGCLHESARASSG